MDKQHILPNLMMYLGYFGFPVSIWISSWSIALKVSMTSTYLIISSILFVGYLEWVEKN